VEEQKDILKRVYLVYILCCVFAVAVLCRVFYIQTVQGEHWKKEASNFMNKEQDIEAVRGNIFAYDGSLLATSLPYYEVGIDPLANPLIDDKEFEDSASHLANGLANVLHDHSAEEYFKTLKSARRRGSRYEQIARDVSYKELQELKKLPLFRAGQFKGGFMYVQSNHRELPFRMLAARTIGYIGDSGRVKVGLEAAFDSVLTGTSGKKVMQKIAGGVWKPLNNENEVDPLQGKDIVTTIDVNIQDVAENALRNTLIQHNAKYGCVVLMEVKTGEIRAIANLTRKDSGVYVEDYNYAIGDAREPGSTFKLASLLVGMDDGLINLTDKLNLEGGQHTYFNRVMHDSHAPKEDVVTVEQAFWESSNVGISKVINNVYAKNPKKFTDGLQELRFGSPLGISIPGEGKSHIRTAGEKGWSGVSLPWISIGYESTITPLQTLTLYNAVANDGVMVKPMFVKEIREKGKTVKIFPPEILNPAIAKPETIAKAKRLLEGVVKNGTAKNLASSVYPIAGKTGTAQIANGKDYGKGGNGVTYQASFVGYFPADAPKYSCIVIVNAPSGDVYYGGLVAGPIFKQIADRVFATEMDIHAPVNGLVNPLTEIPVVKNGLAIPTMIALRGLFVDVKTSPDFKEDGYVSIQTQNKNVLAANKEPEQQLSKGLMPDLSGMAAPDVLFLMENRGYRVRLKGSGSVKRQSVAAGQRITKNTEILVELSL
jgi:cell division protein FtsI (penicillin-binding protein 3)